jgi:two-component system sensor histidine kinase RegB
LSSLHLKSIGGERVYKVSRLIFNNENEQKLFYTDINGLKNPKSLIYLRWFSILTMLLVVIVMHYLQHLETYYKAFYVVLAALIINIIFSRVVSYRTAHGDNVRLFELTLDLLLWGLFLHFSGSVKNPFTFIILPYIAIGAVTMPRQRAWLYGLSALTIYTLLWTHYWYHTRYYENVSDTMQIIGMWFVFALSVVITILFNTNLIEIIKKYEQKLEGMRQNDVHDQWIISLGSQAATTAHEISTPLSTLSTIIDEIRQHGNDPIPVCRSDLELINSQLEVCRRVLKRLSKQAHTSYSNSFDYKNATLWIEEQKEQWDIKYPKIKINLIQDPEYSNCFLVTCISLEQSLNNLVDNAVAVSSEKIHIYTQCTNCYFEISIQDFGPGISDEMISNFEKGSPLKSERGLGLGLILAKRNINRLGGALEIERLQQGGTEARVLLPLCEGFST